jgi:hypothetical protein
MYGEDILWRRKEWVSAFILNTLEILAVFSAPIDRVRQVSQSLKK